MTKEQINKKYKDKYVEIRLTFNYENKKFEYKVLNSYDGIRENTTLGQDVGTSREYTR